MNRVKILVGPSGSGKSTFAKNFVKENPTWIVISRDKIREQLFSYSEDSIKDYYEDSDMNKKEKTVSEFLFNNIRFALAQGYDVLIDNTNLVSRFIKPYIDEFIECEISFEVMLKDLETCLIQDSVRKRNVGSEKIKDQYAAFEDLRSTFSFETIPPRVVPIIPNTDLDKCVIFDIDGTLSNSEHRHIFGSSYEEILKDKVIEEVKEIVTALGVYRNVIFVTGRSERDRKVTEHWLANNVPKFSSNNLYMRKDGDYRKDLIVKEEIFKEISKKYNIQLAIDDRLSVTRHLRKLGIFVLNCNQKGNEF